MKKVKYILTIFIFLFIVFISNEVKAHYYGDYSIEKVNILVSIENDGSLRIEETLKYNIRDCDEINIPISMKLKENEYDEIRNETPVVDKEYYNPSNIEVNSVIVDGKQYKRKDYVDRIVGIKGPTGIYSVDNNQKSNIIEVFSPTDNASRIIFISYTLKNVAVKHNDIGELYYTFIDDEWPRIIDEVNIDIKFSNNMNRENLNVFAHGPKKYTIKIKDKNNVNISAKEVRGYLSGRIIFDLENITQCKKSTNQVALEKIKEQEKNIYYKATQKQRINKNLIMIEVILLAYWLILLVKYERDKKYDIAAKDEEMFEKYNPLIAGCIQGSRDVLSRDIIAVILDLVNKKYLQLDIIPTNNNLQSNENYIYFIRKNKKSDYKLDEIEDYIVNWIYRGEKTYNTNGEECINLLKALKELPTTISANKKFKELNKIAKRTLNKMGANKNKVPRGIRILNVWIFIITIIFAIINIYIYLESSLKNNIKVNELINITLAQVPTLLGIICLVFLVMFSMIKPINKIIQRLNGQKIVIVTLGIIFALIIIMPLSSMGFILTEMIINDLLMATGLLIMLTDNLMLKNDPIMSEDYSRLNALKNKIKNYSMMEDKDIKDTVLWEKYLSYAISFGIANKIAGKIKVMIADDYLIQILDNRDFFDYIVDDYTYFNKNKRNIISERIMNRRYKDFEK